MLQKLGAVPQQIAGGDIYPALEKGTIDAAEWVGPYDDEKLGFQKVAQYYYYPGWWEGGAMLHNFINIEKWNALPPSYKSIVRSASDAGERMDDGEIRRGKSGRLQAADRGRRPVAAVSASGHGGLLQGGERESMRRRRPPTPTSRRSTTAIAAFRSDQYLWWQVAEYTLRHFP